MISVMILMLVILASAWCVNSANPMNTYAHVMCGACYANNGSPDPEDQIEIPRVLPIPIQSTSRQRHRRQQQGQCQRKYTGPPGSLYTFAGCDFKRLLCDLKEKVRGVGDKKAKAKSKVKAKGRTRRDEPEIEDPDSEMDAFQNDWSPGVFLPGHRTPPLAQSQGPADTSVRTNVFCVLDEYKAYDPFLRVCKNRSYFPHLPDDVDPKCTVAMATTDGQNAYPFLAAGWINKGYAMTVDKSGNQQFVLNITDDWINREDFCGKYVQPIGRYTYARQFCPVDLSQPCFD